MLYVHFSHLLNVETPETQGVLALHSKHPFVN